MGERRVAGELDVRDHGALTIQPIDRVLRTLAELDAGHASVVSLYLDARWVDEQERERARLTLKGELAGERRRLASLPELAAALGRDLDRAEEYATSVIRQELDAGFDGVATFHCEHASIDLALLLHIAMPTRLMVAPRAHLLPFATALNDFDLALVAVTDTDETRIFELALGGLAEAVALHGDVPPRVAGGGWRQLRIQKHIADHLLHYHRQAAADLVARFDAIRMHNGRPPRVVIGGRPPLRAAFERNLPERVLARAIHLVAVGSQTKTTQILDEVRVALADELRKVEKEKLALLSDAVRGGRARLGVAGTLSAINEGNLRELVIDAGFASAGATCRGCGRLVLDAASACPACGGALERGPLFPELVRRAILASAEIHIVNDARELAPHSGIAALTRY